MAPLSEQGANKISADFRGGDNFFSGKLSPRPQYPFIMAGLVPAIHLLLHSGTWQAAGFTSTNRRDGSLYVGVTATLPKRAYEHREGLIEGHTKDHGLKRLVYYEWHDTDSVRDPAREEHQALAARVESAVDPRNESGLGRFVRYADLSIAAAGHSYASLHPFVMPGPRLRGGRLLCLASTSFFAELPQARRGWPGQARP